MQDKFYENLDIKIQCALSKIDSLNLRAFERESNPKDAFISAFKQVIVGTFIYATDQSSKNYIKRKLCLCLHPDKIKDKKPALHKFLLKIGADQEPASIINDIADKPVEEMIIELFKPTLFSFPAYVYTPILIIVGIEAVIGYITFLISDMIFSKLISVTEVLRDSENQALNFLTGGKFKKIVDAKFENAFVRSYLKSEFEINTDYKTDNDAKKILIEKIKATRSDISDRMKNCQTQNNYDVLYANYLRNNIGGYMHMKLYLIASYKYLKENEDSFARKGMSASLLLLLLPFDFVLQTINFILQNTLLAISFAAFAPALITGALFFGPIYFIDKCYKKDNSDAEFSENLTGNNTDLQGGVSADDDYANHEFVVGYGSYAWID